MGDIRTFTFIIKKKKTAITSIWTVKARNYWERYDTIKSFILNKILFLKRKKNKFGMWFKKKFRPLNVYVFLMTDLGMHPYRIALQLLQCGRSTYRDDNHGHFWGIPDYSGWPVYRQRDGNASEPSRGMF